MAWNPVANQAAFMAEQQRQAQAAQQAADVQRRAQLAAQAQAAQQAAAQRQAQIQAQLQAQKPAPAPVQQPVVKPPVIGQPIQQPPAQVPPVQQPPQHIEFRVPTAEEQAQQKEQMYQSFLNRNPYQQNMGGTQDLYNQYARQAATINYQPGPIVSTAARGIPTYQDWLSQDPNKFLGGFTPPARTDANGMVTGQMQIPKQSPPTQSPVPGPVAPMMPTNPGIPGLSGSNGTPVTSLSAPGYTNSVLNGGARIA